MDCQDLPVFFLGGLRNTSAPGELNLAFKVEACGWFSFGFRFKANQTGVHLSEREKAMVPGSWFFG